MNEIVELREAYYKAIGEEYICLKSVLIDNHLLYEKLWKSLDSAEDDFQRGEIFGEMRRLAGQARIIKHVLEFGGSLKDYLDNYNSFDGYDQLNELEDGE